MVLRRWPARIAEYASPRRLPRPSSTSVPPPVESPNMASSASAPTSRPSANVFGSGVGAYASIVMAEHRTRQLVAQGSWPGCAGSFRVGQACESRRCPSSRLPPVSSWAAASSSSRRAAGAAQQRRGPPPTAGRTLPPTPGSSGQDAASRPARARSSAWRRASARRSSSTRRRSRTAASASRAASSELVCGCGDSICSMGAFTTCAQAAALLTSQTEQQVCTQLAEGRCSAGVPTPGTSSSSSSSGSSCDKACLSECGGGGAPARRSAAVRSLEGSAAELACARALRGRAAEERRGARLRRGARRRIGLRARRGAGALREARMRDALRTASRRSRPWPRCSTTSARTSCTSRGP